MDPTPNTINSGLFDKNNIYGQKEINLGKTKGSVKVYKENNAKLCKFPKDSRVSKITNIGIESFSVKSESGVKEEKKFNLFKVEKNLERNIPLGLFLSVISGGMALFSHKVRDMFFNQKTTLVAVPLNAPKRSFSNNLNPGVLGATSLRPDHSIDTNDYLKESELFTQAYQEYMANAERSPEEIHEFVEKYFAGSGFSERPSLSNPSLELDDSKKQNLGAFRRSMLALSLYDNFPTLSKDMNQQQRIDFYTEIRSHFNRIAEDQINPLLDQGYALGLLPLEPEDYDSFYDNLASQLESVKAKLLKGEDSSEELKDIFFHFAEKDYRLDTAKKQVNQMLKELAQEVTVSKQPFETYQKIYQACQGCIMEEKSSGYTHLTTTRYLVTDRFASLNVETLATRREDRLHEMSQQLAVKDPNFYENFKKIYAMKFTKEDQILFDGINKDPGRLKAEMEHQGYDDRYFDDKEYNHRNELQFPTRLVKLNQTLLMDYINSAETKKESLERFLKLNKEINLPLDEKFFQIFENYFQKLSLEDKLIELEELYKKVPFHAEKQLKERAIPLLCTDLANLRNDRELMLTKLETITRKGEKLFSKEWTESLKIQLAFTK